MGAIEKIIGLFTDNAAKYGKQIGKAGKYKIYQTINGNGETVVTSLKKDGSIFRQITKKTDNVTLNGSNFQNKTLRLEDFVKNLKKDRSRTFFAEKDVNPSKTGIFQYDKWHIRDNANSFSEFGGTINNISKPGEYYGTYHSHKNGVYTWTLKDEFLDHVRTTKGLYTSSAQLPNGTMHHANFEVRTEWDPISKKYVDIRPRSEQRFYIRDSKTGDIILDSEKTGNHNWQWNFPQK